MDTHSAYSHEADSDDELAVLPLDVTASADFEPEPEDAPLAAARDHDDRDPTQLYFKALANSRLLTAEEERHYGTLARQGDAEAFRVMVESNLRLVVKLARRYLNRGLPILDLVSEGNLGLMHAVEKFEPERGFRFSTYAAWWIRQDIEKAIMNQSRTIRLPIHVVKELNGYLRAFRQLSMRMPQDPDAKDVAAFLDKPVAAVEKVLRMNEKLASLDSPVKPGSDQTVVDLISDEAQLEIPDRLQHETVERKLGEWLGGLPEPQREILSRRFGLSDGESETLEQVAAALGMPRERVRQLQQAALHHLRETLEAQGFDAEILFH
jgi:RNA polymerase nonessential primary-like sigma factor